MYSFHWVLCKIRLLGKRIPCLFICPVFADDLGNIFGALDGMHHIFKRNIHEQRIQDEKLTMSGCQSFFQTGAFFGGADQTYIT